MSFIEAVNMIGKTVSVRMEGFWVDMIVTEVKQAYGSFRFLVSPSAGSGSAWVDESRVRVSVKVG